MFGIVFVPTWTLIQWKWNLVTSSQQIVLVISHGHCAMSMTFEMLLNMARVLFVVQELTRLRS